MLVDVADGSVEAALNRRSVVSSSTSYAYWNFLAEDRGRVGSILRQLQLPERPVVVVPPLNRRFTVLRLHLPQQAAGLLF